MTAVLRFLLFWVRVDNEMITLYHFETLSIALDAVELQLGVMACRVSSILRCFDKSLAERRLVILFFINSNLKMA